MKTSPVTVRLDNDTLAEIALTGLTLSEFIRSAVDEKQPEQD